MGSNEWLLRIEARVECPNFVIDLLLVQLAFVSVDHKEEEGRAATQHEKDQS